MATAATNDPQTTGRYEYLLQQVVQLNTDLHKTVAMSQSLKAERDALKDLSDKLKQELQRSEEKCEKMHTILMNETEHKVQSDRKHEQLVQKWKQQLEMKAKEFEALQKNLAPPKDLDQLRMKIQDEVELPHRQRVQSLQMDIEKFRDMFFHTRRDYEILKTEHEQVLISHGNEIESMEATHTILLQNLKRKLEVAEEKAEDMAMVERLRKMEQDRETILLENQKLRIELEQLRAAKNDLIQASEAQATKLQASIADIMLHRTNAELELKSTSRQRLKEEMDKLIRDKDDVEKKLREQSDEVMRLREQLKQKELAFSENQSLYNTKARELRHEIEVEKSQFKEKQNEYIEQIAHLQQVHDQLETMYSKREKEWQIESVRSQATTSKDCSNLKETILSEKSVELAKAQEELETREQKLNAELEQEQFKLQRLQGEKDSLHLKFTTNQELVTKLKSEILNWRAQYKEMEQEYRSLQSKHSQQDNLSLMEQQKAKVEYLEEDIAQLNSKMTAENAHHTQVQQHLQSQLDESVSAALAVRRSLQRELKSNMSKLSHSLNKSEKKRDAYKHKCLEVHERYKKAKSDRDALMIEIQQLKESHQNELQHLLQQWSIGENEKTQQLLNSSLFQPVYKITMAVW
ncbi:hypothetical protein THRCLA_03456 [Thraustotheca clavata]|uniref:Uncharacterized protein n=1 Tax=Thraustotheca clavata TaxID=74557 RepID=A0A1W0A1Z5_9STRA|nr:hypothetical protein THRCLA_03456 [Thraustotheca clavata]